MAETIKEPEAYPLEWPITWPRCPAEERAHAAYKVTFARARNELVRELRLLGATNVIISSNVRTGRSGLLPAGEYREPKDPGVAVYWDDARRRRRVIPCDVWRTVRDNMRAVGLAVEHMRGLERTGAGDIVERAFSGFLLAQTAGPNAEPFWDVLGVPPNATEAQVRGAFRELSRTHHPDRGGDKERWNRISAAYAAALEDRA